ncbi:hypothetical protein H9L39_02318 [Fusarium oxysporum f. sp. albedinis]|nr:hypothetical protein H9L39_02318 [Fusarium oxysporum f. sp. albedinis]
MKDFEALYRKEYPKTPVLGLDKLWTSFMRDLTTKMKAWTKKWLEYRAREMAKDWAAENAKRLALMASANSPAAVAAVLSHAQEAKTILDKAQEHEKKHGIAINKFDPNVVFK